MVNIGSKKRVYKKIFMIVIFDYKIWDSCDFGTECPTYMQPLESIIYALSIFYVKLRICVHEFLQWELVCSFVFIFEQVHIWYKSEWVFSLCLYAHSYLVVT